MGNRIPREFKRILATTLVDSSCFTAGTRVVITKDDRGYHAKGPDGKVCQPFVSQLRNEHYYRIDAIL